MTLEGYRVASTVIKRVTVYIDPATNAKMLEWTVDAAYTPESVELLFYVEVSRAAGSWSRLNPDEPVINNCFYTDETRYRFNLRHSTYYRIVLDDGGTLAYSAPVNVKGVWTARQYSIARNILRQEYKRLDKNSAGRDGWLLKRRLWGVTCTVCQEYDIKTNVDPTCPICYGTGIVGGYYDALAYPMEFKTGVLSAEDIQFPFGTVSDQIFQTRSIAYPVLGAKDIWVDAKSNERYMFGIIKSAAELVGIPLLYDNVVAEFPPDAPEYSVPLVQSESGSSSSSGSSSGEDSTDDSWDGDITFTY